MPSMPSVPLTRASPSFASRRTGGIPASPIALAPGTAGASPIPIASPSPMRTRAQWASGARSPLHPSEPWSATRGVTPALSMAARVSATTGRTPVRPPARVFRRRNISARTTSRSTGGPMPAAWLRMRRTWSSWRRSAGMCRVASAPNPVEMPYAGREEAASRSTVRRDAAMASMAASSNRTRAR